MTSLYRLIRRTPVPRETYAVRPCDTLCPTGDDPGSKSADWPESRIKQAYGAGYDAGYAACREAFAAQTEDAVGDFKAMVDDLAAQRGRLVKESEEAVLEVACAIARRVVGKSAELREGVVLEVVRNALGHMKDTNNVTIMVSPRDYEVLAGCEAEWIESARSRGMRIKQDVRIKPGGCLVEGESGCVEAQLDRQIDIIEKALMEACK
jgi:flagellar assembly protein FliH